MTRGNWLPGYHGFAALVVATFGRAAMPALKGANVLFSLGTTAVVYGLARPRGRDVAILAAALFALSPADVVIASFATPESLTLFTAFSGVLLVERRPFGSRTSLALGAAAFLVAATLRYEAWGFIAVYLGVASLRRRMGWREGLLLALPALAFMLGWWAWTSPYGFLPSIVVGQTSTDLRFKESIGVLAPAGERISGFLAWYLGWTPFAAVALVWAAWKERGTPWTAILATFYGAIAAYTVVGFGHPSARYIHLTVPIVCILSATAILRTRASLAAHPRLRRAGRLPIPATVLVSILLVALVANPTPAPGTMLGGMERAGRFLEGLELPEGKILVTESPIAAYYSGYPASRMLGSSFLPTEPAEAEQFLVEHAAYVVMVTVPYYRLRTLFPDLADGANGHHLRLLFDATGPEYDLGAPRVLVFEVVP